MNFAKKSPEITGWRELTPGDVAAPVKREGIKSIRDPHHLLAKYFAMGYGTSEAAEQAGYSISRASILRGDPAFSELVEQYRERITGVQLEAVDEYYAAANRVRAKSMRMIEEKLDGITNVDETPFRDLVMIHSDLADRTGYPKRSVAVNVNVDFAARLDQAIVASNKAKLLNPSGAASSLLPTGTGGELEDRPALPRVMREPEAEFKAIEDRVERRTLVTAPNLKQSLLQIKKFEDTLKKLEQV